MLPKVLVILLNLSLILQSRVLPPPAAVKNEAPAQDAEAPTPNTKAPAQVTKALAQVTKALAQVTKAPAQVTEAPAQVTEAPAQEAMVYGPQLPPVEKKYLSKETKSEFIQIGRPSGKLPEASRILNTILSNYDHKLRPGIGKKPTVVTVEVSVNSLGPLSILDMEYTIDIIFYQTWYDERLRYNDTFETLVLNGDVVSQLWIPDTFFRNSRKTQEHALTMPNQMVRIHKDGKVLYTIRMTIDAGCSLHMFKFPMDSHSCPLSFSSFSYSKSEVIYKWANFKLEINEKNSWKLFQFYFTGLSNKTEIILTPAGDLNEEPRVLPRGAPRASLETFFTRFDQVQGRGGTTPIVSRMVMERVIQPAICNGRQSALPPCG